MLSKSNKLVPCQATQIMDSEKIIYNIGNFGFYQKIQLLFLGILWIGNGIQLLLNVFILYVPKFRCAIPGWNNDTYKFQSEIQEWYINHTISSRDKHCYIYQRNASDYIVNTNTHIEIKCDSWVYDKSVILKTASTEMNFVCDNTVFISVMDMLFMAGVLVGSFVVGLISDKYGRKPALYLSLVVLILSTVPLYVVNNIEILAVLRFFAGGSAIAVFMIPYILAMEMVTSPYRSRVAMLCQMLFAVGEIAVSGIAYFLRDWHLLNLVASLINLPCLLFWFITDESPRWLVQNGKLDKAETIFQKIAKRNKTIFSRNEQSNLLDQTEEEPLKQSSLIDLFRSRILLIRSLIIFFNWGVINLVYFGLLFKAGNLADNLYLSSFLYGVAELSSYVFLFFTMDRWGRKPLYCSGIILSGIGCITSGFVQIYGKDLPWLATALAVIGKFAISGSYAIIYTITIELFPTVVRNAGLGVSSCIGRIGSLVAPYITLSGQYIPSKFGPALPLVLFGILSGIAGFLSLYLPETLGQKLPETIEDGENFGRKKLVKGHVNDGMHSSGKTTGGAGSARHQSPEPTGGPSQLKPTIQ